MRRHHASLIVCILATSVVACADKSATPSNTAAESASTLPATTTTDAPTFCGVAEVYATEVLDALENETNSSALDSPMNTRAFWTRYKELHTQLRDMAPAEIAADAGLAYESAMAAYDYMESYGFSMMKASKDPSFAEDSRFTGPKYLKAASSFQAYIDKNCKIQLTK